MEHIKKYWILYTILTVGIIWLIVWGRKTGPCGGENPPCPSPTNFQMLFKQSKKSSANDFFRPVDSEGNCPKGWFHASGMTGEDIGCTPVQIYT